jgi:hypothetical protein
MTCRWDRDREEYLADGEPCLVDDYGDPTRHCQARRTCANHVGANELTCARCLSRTRQDIRVIVGRTPELMTQAITTGVESEAANLAGPAADVEAWMWRKIAARQGHAWHVSLLEDDDEEHPYTVLTRWEMMLREDYGQPLRSPTSTEAAAAYLERILPRLAQDDEQDFGLFAREIRRCRAHLEAVLMDSQQPERGAPCPTCPQPAPKLTLERGHWCHEPDCDRMHWPDDPDRWLCPRDREHWWTEVDYRRWVADVYEASKEAVG